MRAHTLIRRILAVSTLAVVLLASGVISPPAAQAAIRRPERKLARMVNNYRVNHQENRLALRANLSRVAERNSKRMAESGSITHTPLGEIPCQGRKGEVAGAGDGVGGAFRNLKNSTPHRQIILRPYWKKMGTGVRRGNNGLTYVTIIFCD